MAAACHYAPAGAAIGRVGLANDTMPRCTIKAKSDTEDGERESMPHTSRPKQGVVNILVALLDV